MQLLPCLAPCTSPQRALPPARAPPPTPRPGVRLALTPQAPRCLVQVIVMGLVGGLKSISYILLLLALVFYLYAILGMILFKGNGSAPPSTLTRWGGCTVALGETSRRAAGAVAWEQGRQRQRPIAARTRGRQHRRGSTCEAAQARQHVRGSTGEAAAQASRHRRARWGVV